MDGLHLAAPILIVALTGVIVLLIEAFSDAAQARKTVCLLTGLTGLAASLCLLIGQWPTSGDSRFFANLGVADNFSALLNIILLICTALSLLISVEYLETRDALRGEFYALVLFAATGMMIMVSSTNLVVLFLGLEITSISSYILSGYFRERPTSIEAGMKYFLMGAFATGIIFYGIVLLYGVSQPIGQWAEVFLPQETPRPTLDLADLSRYLIGAMAQAGGQIEEVPNHALLLTAVALIVVGFGFKIAAVPFHAWAPDVYEGAPTPVTAFMATGIKAAAFGATVRIFWTALGPLYSQWYIVFVVVAILTMSIGNLVALTQMNLKRMLAYSGIAHAGYMLVAVCVSDSETGNPAAAIIYYLIAYCFMNLGAFAVISFLETREGRGVSLDDYSGLAGKHPFLCAAMGLFMLSLGGIPLTGGFLGKFFVFRSALYGGKAYLAVIAIMNSLISLYYYLRVMVRMYMDKPVPVREGEAPPKPSAPLAVAIGVAAVATLWLGIGPQVGFGIGDIWNWATLSAQSLSP